VTNFLGYPCKHAHLDFCHSLGPDFNAGTRTASGLQFAPLFKCCCSVWT